MNEGESVKRYKFRPETVKTERGGGSPIVFAHGMLMDRTMFEPQLTALSDSYRTIAYDLRARTDRYAGPYDLYNLVDDLKALLDTLDLETIVLAGISMGGFVALRFADRYPERVEGLILINSMANSHTESEQLEYKNLATQIRQNGIGESLVEIGKQKMFGKTTLEDNPDLVKHWVDRWRTYPKESVYYEVHSWVDRSDFTKNLSEIKIPVLSIHGIEDTVIAPERTESTLEALPWAQQTLIPNGGHSVPIEQPDLVNQTIKEFVSGI